MNNTVLKSTPAQLKAAKTYSNKNRSTINDHMVSYYAKNREVILQKKKILYKQNKAKKELIKLASKETV